MPNTFTAATRATDDDRVQVCRTLDQALAEGQLTGAEHESRVSAAMHAKTVRELRSLVGDLQSGNPMPHVRPEQPPGTAVFRFLVPAAATVLLLVLLVSLAGRCSGPESDTAADATGAAAADSDSLLSVAGLTRLIAGIEAEIGTTQVDDLTVYPDYAVVYIPDPQAPRLRLSYYYDGEFDSPSEAGTSSYDDTVDIATADVERIARVILGAGESLNLSRVDTVYAIFRNLDGTPEVLIHANNERGESGHLSVTPTGEFLYTNPFDPGN